MTARRATVTTLTCSPQSNRDRVTCGHRMRECRSLPCSLVLESDGLDSTTERRVSLFQPIDNVIERLDTLADLVQGFEETVREGTVPLKLDSPHTMTLIHPRRQREYPQPPPPSTNSTTRTINAVSMW
jgi:hypothetical protein